jgi:hypothetical protein
MFIATVILVIGKPLYVFKAPQGNITAQVCGGIWVDIYLSYKNNSNLFLKQLGNVDLHYN